MSVTSAGVTEHPIDVPALAGQVAGAGDGAVVTFAGVVRDHDGGLEVIALEYHGHPSASDVVGEVAASIVERFPGVTLAVWHRTGTLVVGDVVGGCGNSGIVRGPGLRDGGW